MQELTKAISIVSRQLTGAAIILPSTESGEPGLDSFKSHLQELANWSHVYRPGHSLFHEVLGLNSPQLDCTGWLYTTVLNTSQEVFQG